MSIDFEFMRSGSGRTLAIGAVLVVAAGVLSWRRAHRSPQPLPPPPSVKPAVLPKVIQRPGARLEPPPPVAPAAPIATSAPAAKAVPVVLPLAVVPRSPSVDSDGAPTLAPFGRLIPCQTLVALESNRLATPVIGLVTEDLWENGTLVVPAGAEVHGRASLDRVRERIAVEGTWTVVCRDQDHPRARELRLTGIALERSPDSRGSIDADGDGSAGLRGVVVRSEDWREVKLFAATFLSSATAALQEGRATAGVFGEGSVPLTTARNASLAGSGAILREYATQLRDAIARDGFYLRVPAGKPFYLYVTQTIERDSSSAASAVLPRSATQP